MYRTALRTASRPAASSLRSCAVRAAPRRFASSSSPADKPRSWKSSALRWGLAGGALYYYFTSPTFADPATSKSTTAPAAFSNADLPTVDSVLEEKRNKPAPKPVEPKAEPEKTATKPETKPAAAAAEQSQSDAQQPADAAAPAPGSPAALEEEAGQQGAFNPETGEINWDCPCLGGMADGPCGEEFKTAFSCFVYSTEEPKGMDCIDKFQGMQTCFKKYPEIYGAELADDDDEGGEPVPDFGDAPADAPVDKTAEAQQSEPVKQEQQAVEKTEPTAPAHVAPAHVASSEEKVEPAETRQFDATPANEPVKKEAAADKA